jgi:hypothetical protein
VAGVRCGRLAAMQILMPTEVGLINSSSTMDLTREGWARQGADVHALRLDQAAGGGLDSGLDAGGGSEFFTGFVDVEIDGPLG